MNADPEPLRLVINEQHSISGLWRRPDGARACFVFAHGAGAGMTHPFLQKIAEGLEERGVATLRYQFPFMEAGLRRPDRPDLVHAAVRAAVAAAGRLASGLALVAGGKSFGGRMTSQAQAAFPLPGVQGLAFLGFPLHPAGRPSNERGRHLFDVVVPMLFLQGTRDALADRERITELCDRLGPRARLRLLQDADHSFRVPARSGRTDAQVREEVLDAFAAWIDSAISS